VSFLSKAEVRKWPVIGWLTEKSGALYIQRGGQNASQLASQKIADRINHEGDSVMVFPEATTTDGKDVKKFHARIFAPALDHGLRVQPIALRYLTKEGEYHPKVAWGDESFLSNVFDVLGESSIYVELHFLEMIDASDFAERKHLSEHARKQIREIVAS
jgi:1-acyl-sn-glycerol-3-phosphate acyltransferase